MSLYRLPLYVVGEGPPFVETDDPDEAALVRAAFADQWAYMHGRVDPSVLDGWCGTRLAGQLVETDPDVLDELGRRGEADPGEWYRELFR